jgi:hypothetical protein
MPANRWIDKSQPQTLMIATLIMYVNAVLALLTGAFLVFPIGTVLILSPVAGLGIANEKKWGYWLGVAFAVLDVVFVLLYFSAGSLINLIFYVALVALLLHPQSRAYRRIWFH